MSKKLFIFVLGSVVGAAVAGYYVKKKYEQISQEEIESVKETFSKKKDISNDDVEECDDYEPIEIDDNSNHTTRKPSITAYSSLLKQKQYSTIKKDNPVELPYVISPDDFGDFDEYEKISLTYYADKVLADDNDEMIDDVDDVVGTKSLTTFGQYEEDAVYVRNDRLKCDYEILKDHRLYSSVVNGTYHEVDE